LDIFSEDFDVRFVQSNRFSVQTKADTGYIPPRFSSFSRLISSILLFGRTYPLYGNHLQDFEAPHDIERCPG